MSVTSRGAGLRPRLPALRGAARPARRGDAGAVPGLDPPGPRAAPIVAPEGRPVRRCWRSSPCRPSINVGIGYVTRDRAVNRIEIVTYRDYVGVSSALLLFVAIIAPDVMLPRSAPTGAAADVRPTAHRARLRRRQGRGDRVDHVRLLVPAPGGAVPRQHARERQRARLPDGTPRRALEGAGGSARAGRVLRHRRRRRVVVHRPADRRRRVHHRHLPRDVDRRGGLGRRQRPPPRWLACRGHQRPGPPAVPARRHLPRHGRPALAAQRGATTVDCSRSACTSSCSPPERRHCFGATAGSSDDACASPPVLPPPAPARRPPSANGPTRRSSSIRRSRSAACRCGSAPRWRCPS